MSDNEVELIEDFGRGRSSLSRRLLAISDEERHGGRPGVWLTRRMRDYRRENGLEGDHEPTEEDIRKQVVLPSREQVQTNRFKEPIKQWVEAGPSDQVPWLSWNREILPEVEVVRSPDRRPSPPPMNDISLLRFKEHFEREIIPSTSHSLVPTRRMALMNNSDDDNEVVICESDTVIRTTVGALRRSSSVQE